MALMCSAGTSLAEYAEKGKEEPDTVKREVKDKTGLGIDEAHELWQEL